MNEINNPIDFVITWVDDNDKEWQQQRRMYQKTNISDEIGGDCRYRDWEILKYWFRAIEENAPWVNTIHFVTCGQKPAFLRDSHPKLHFVSHSDYMPESYLPTFSSIPIEINMYRIEGLTSKFVYFNDDVFLNQKCIPEDFFINEKPCYMFTQRVKKGLPDALINSRIVSNCMDIINKHFSVKDTISKGIDKLFSHNYGKKAIYNLIPIFDNQFHWFSIRHYAIPFLKSTMEEVWNTEYKVMDETSKHRFRDENDISQYIFRFWDLARGNFHPYSPELGEYGISTSCVGECCKDIEEEKHKFICINDNENCDDYDLCKQKIIAAFEKRYPKKSSFEW